MSSITLVDKSSWLSLHPLTLNRSVADIRMGISTIKEKWNFIFSTEINVFTVDYLQKKYGPIPEEGVFINSAILPNTSIFQRILELNPGESLFRQTEWIASKGTQKMIGLGREVQLEDNCECILLHYPEDIFINIGNEITKDIERLDKNDLRPKLSQTNQIIGNNKVYLETGAWVECATFNTTNGPVYIGENAQIMEGSHIRGPFALGESSIVKMGTRIYENTSVGSGCKVGGEIKNSVIFGNSNKSHDGYMGNSVIGEWCNWGADTNNSNMKNNYSNVSLWDYSTHSFRRTERQFLGLIMGDHSKTGINTMFNTATVVGVSCNLFGSGYPRKYIPSFSWGGAHGFATFRIQKALETARMMMQRRSMNLNKTEEDILTHIFNATSPNRPWEK